MRLNKRSKGILLAVSASGAVVCALLIMRSANEAPQEALTELKRPDYGQEDYIYSLNAVYGDKSYTVEVPISAQKPDDSKLQAAFDSAFEYICEKMTGENPSLNEVRSNLVFPATVPEYGMSVDYTLDDYSAVNCFGEVDNGETAQEGENYTVYAQITYGALSQSYEIPITVLPPVYSDEEREINRILSELAEADKTSEGEAVRLPESVDGRDIAFTRKTQSRASFLLLLPLAALVLWYYKRFVVKKRAESERETQLRLDYSEIVSKLSLLMGAGMSGANAFARISRDYADAKKEKGERIRYGYEEISAASNRIASGTSEAEAYAAFGRACRSHSYIKLASLMTQNVIKGTEGFNMLLRGEVTEAFAERKALARTKGEEAGTKLLMPMIMMLCVVLVIIIVPAFMSF
ncbi:MAG: hypothetical protein NC223_00575 [Butyrivibrio sp.]|nr:hypothetical protein [Butyrivibrio sp.]